MGDYIYPHTHTHLRVKLEPLAANIGWGESTLTTNNIDLGFTQPD